MTGSAVADADHRRVLADRGLVAILVGGALLRLVAVAGVTPTIYVDSGEYRDVAWFGGNRRPWTVPLLHAAVGDATLRVLAHAVLGAVAWAFLAVAVAESVTDRTVRLLAAAAVMGTGVTSVVANYDATITSETVAISLTVALLAAWIRLARAPSVGRALVVVAVAVPFAFTREDHPLLLSALTLVATACWVLGRRRRAWGALAIGLLVTSVWSVAAARRNDEVESFNLALVMANRIVPVPEYLAWFEGWGMPRPDDFGRRLDGDMALSYAEDVDWNRWAEREGAVAYGRFLVTHPDHLLLEPLPDLLGLRSTTLEVPGESAALLSPDDRYGRARPVLPDPLEALVWGPGNPGPVLLALVGLTALAVRALLAERRAALRRLGPARAVATAALLVAAGHLLLVWHASPIELDRHAMAPATTVHAALLVLVAVTADRAVAARRPTGS